MPAGEVLLSKHYRNAENGSFTECCQKFLAEADALTGGERPKTCCLAVRQHDRMMPAHPPRARAHEPAPLLQNDRCAGGIVDNTVSFTNVKNGWTIDGTALQSALGPRPPPSPSR